MSFSHPVEMAALALLVLTLVVFMPRLGSSRAELKTAKDIEGMRHDHEFRCKSLEHDVQMGKLGLKKSQFDYEVKKDGFVRRDAKAALKTMGTSNPKAPSNTDAANDATTRPAFRAGELLAADEDAIRTRANSKKNGAKRKPKSVAASEAPAAPTVTSEPETCEGAEHTDIPERESEE